jgi:hypothetical protein
MLPTRMRKALWRSLLTNLSVPCISALVPLRRPLQDPQTGCSRIRIRSRRNPGLAGMGIRWVGAYHGKTSDSFRLVPKMAQAAAGGVGFGAGMSRSIGNSFCAHEACLSAQVRRLEAGLLTLYFNTKCIAVLGLGVSVSHLRAVPYLFMLKFLASDQQDQTCLVALLRCGIRPQATSHLEPLHLRHLGPFHRWPRQPRLSAVGLGLPRLFLRHSLLGSTTSTTASCTPRAVLSVARTWIT